MTALILAAADLPDEAMLVAAAPTQGLSITRRCVDAADLLAAAAAGRTTPVAVTAGMPRLTGDLARRLIADDRAVVGIAIDDDTDARLRTWGLTAVLRHDGDAAATLRGIALATDRHRPPLVTEPPIPEGRGTLVAVWGPAGAPGTTTTAIGMAEALAARGTPTCLIDADTRAPSMAAHLGVVDDVSGLLIACRHADHGTLSPSIIVQCARRIAPGLDLLGGLVHIERWADLRESAARSVLDAARQSHAMVVVDVGAALPVEGSATLTVHRATVPAIAIADADRLIAVGRATTLGLTRLLQELPLLPREPDVIVLTGEHVPREAGAIIREAGWASQLVELARRPRDLERAMRAGVSARESADRRERRALDAVADACVGAEARGRGGRRRGRRR